MIPHNAIELLERHVDGTLADDDIPRLQALLRESSEARAKLRSLAAIDFGLHDLAAAYEDAADAMPLSSVNKASQSHSSRGLWKTIWPYGIVIAATVLVVVGVQTLWRSSGEDDPLVNPQRVQEEESRYVASVASLVDCRWAEGQPVLREGERLSATTVVLELGVAEIRFDGGATLVFQGPAECRIESESAASLSKGKGVFRNTDDKRFDLQTPSSVLVSRDAEYTISVETRGEDVCVLRGELRRTSRKSQDDIDLILAGQVRCYGNDDTGRRVPTR